jgi:hypothetical protein
VNSENRTTLAILILAMLSLILAGVFEPRTGVEARALEQSQQYVLEDLSSWLFRFAALVPAGAPSGHPDCRPNTAQGATSSELF